MGASNACRLWKKSRFSTNILSMGTRMRSIEWCRFQWPYAYMIPAQISRSRNYLSLDISETAKDTAIICYGMRIGYCTQAFDDLEWLSKIFNGTKHRAASLHSWASCCSAMLCISAAYAVIRCLSVRLSMCLSATFVDSVKTNKHIFKIFHRRVAHIILVFFVPNIMTIFRREPPNGGVKCRWSMQ